MSNIILLVGEERRGEGIFSGILLDIDCPWLSPGLWYNTKPPARPRVSTTLAGEMREMRENWFTVSQPVSDSKKIIRVAKHSVALSAVRRAARCQIGSWLILTWLDASSPAQPWLAHLFSYAGQKAGLDLCKYDGSDGSDGSVRPCDPSPRCIEARRVAWQQLLSVLMGYNYIGIVSFLHYHQYTPLTALLFIRKITAQQSSVFSRDSRDSRDLPGKYQILFTSIQSPNIFYSRKNFLFFNAFCRNYL